MLEQYVSDIVASTFVHELVNKKVDREYLSPLRAMRGRCSLPAHSGEHRPLCWNLTDAQSSRIVLCSRCRRSLCVLKASGCAEQS